MQNLNPIVQVLREWHEGLSVLSSGHRETKEITLE